MKKLLLISALLFAQPGQAADVAVGETVIQNDNIVFVCIRVVRKDDAYIREVCFDPYDATDEVDIQACGIFYLEAGGMQVPYDDCTDWYPVDRVVIE